MSKLFCPLTMLGTLLTVPAAAQAHVSASPATAAPGAYAAIAFRVGHSCAAGLSTTALRIEIPAEMVSVHYQPKPGWTVVVERDGDKVAAVTWTGRLAEDEFDDFSLFLQMPKAPGALYFPAIQSCGEVQTQWTEIVDPGEQASHPAPKVTLAPAASSTPVHEHAP